MQITNPPGSRSASGFLYESLLTSHRFAQCTPGIRVSPSHYAVSMSYNQGSAPKRPESNAFFPSMRRSLCNCSSHRYPERNLTMQCNAK